MEIQLADLLIIIDGAFASTRATDDLSLESHGCKYSVRQIIKAINRINSEIGSLITDVKEEEKK